MFLEEVKQSGIMVPDMAWQGGENQRLSAWRGRANEKQTDSLHGHQGQLREFSIRHL